MPTVSLARPAHDWKRLATMAAVLACALAMLGGLAAFALSFRSVSLSLPPGRLVTWHLATTSTELAEDGREARPTVQESELMLIGLGEDGEAALLAPGPDGTDQVSLHRFAPDGSCRLLDPAGRELPGSRTIGVFDFNLLPLPPGRDQSWEPTVDYGLPPPAKGQLAGRARRVKSGTSPEFQFRLPASIEWVAQDRYRQVWDLQSSYRWSSSHRLVDRASVRLVWGVEREDRAHRYRVLAELVLRDDRDLGDDPQRLRELLRGCAEAQGILRGGRGGRVQVLASRLRGSDVGIPRLRVLADRLADALIQGRYRPDPAPERGPGCWLQAAIFPAIQRGQADQLLRLLQAGGWRASARPGPNGSVAILVGPFPQRDPSILAEVGRRFPYLNPVWTAP